MHCMCATLAVMKSSTLPAVRVEPELRAELEAVRRAVDFRRVQADFHARGEAAWQRHLQTAESRPVDEVFDRVQARIDAQRNALNSRLPARR